MEVTFGERIAQIIIDAEAECIGYFLIDRDLEERLAAYLQEPDLCQRFLEDAATISGEPAPDLVGAFLLLLPRDYYFEFSVLGLRVKPEAARCRDIHDA